MGDDFIRAFHVLRIELEGNLTENFEEVFWLRKSLTNLRVVVWGVSMLFRQGQEHWKTL